MPTRATSRSVFPSGPVSPDAVSTLEEDADAMRDGAFNTEDADHGNQHTDLDDV